MRVISGKYKHRHFDPPKGFKARPTTDFAKENIFNVLSNRIDFGGGVTALDLFSGTGNISLELLSRGCDEVVAVEKEPLHYKFIVRLLKEIGERHCKIVFGDAMRFVKSTDRQFDFIFADPPYDLKELPSLPQLILEETNVLNAGGVFVLEHGKANDFEDNPFFVEHRSYGSVNFTLFSKQGTEHAND